LDNSPFEVVQLSTAELSFGLDLMLTHSGKSACSLALFFCSFVPDSEVPLVQPFGKPFVDQPQKTPSVFMSVFAMLVMLILKPLIHWGLQNRAILIKSFPPYLLDGILYKEAFPLIF
jgi:hypothetical protein